MLDPVSIAGLTLAVIEALLKVGERTSELVSDAAAYEEDTAQLRNLINDENGRTRLLKVLLFSELPVYGNHTLFEQFDADFQGQIELLVGELKSILQEGSDILHRRYGLKTGTGNHHIVSRSSDLSTGSTLAPTRQAGIPVRRASPSLFAPLRWSLLDKKRVENIVRSFSDRNDRLHEKVKLWCLASQLGLQREHLQHLQRDEASKRLGFDKDATLRLTQWDAQSMGGTLELTDPSWDHYLKDVPCVQHQGMFKMFHKDGVAMIQENHAYGNPLQLRATIDAGKASALDPRTRNRVDSLAKLLHQPKERVFRVLPCVGWRYLPVQKSIAFVFEIHPLPDGEPSSLLRLLFEPDRRPELGDKFRLALGLSRALSQIHMVKWVHESFRSENLLLFPYTASSDNGTKRGINYTEPWVLGFEFSRPEPFFSAGEADFEPSRDIYRHPDRQGQPQETFKKIHDIYSLGVVLLEIGLWEPAIKLEKNMFAHASNAYAVQAQLIKHAQRRLKPRVGQKYEDIVVKCLTGNLGIPDDTRDDLKLQQAFRTQVVDVIEMAASYV